MQQRRLELLDAAVKEAGDGPVDLTRVIEAFILPPLEMIETAPRFVPLMGRIYTEPQYVKEIIEKHMLPYKEILIHAMRRACPGLSDEALIWRLHFSIGAMSHVMAGRHLVQMSSEGRCNPGDLEATRRQLIPFIVAGYRAPEPKEP